MLCNAIQIQACKLRYALQYKYKHVNYVMNCNTIQACELCYALQYNYKHVHYIMQCNTNTSM